MKGKGSRFVFMGIALALAAMVAATAPVQAAPRR